VLDNSGEQVYEGVRCRLVSRDPSQAQVLPGTGLQPLGTLSPEGGHTPTAAPFAVLLSRSLPDGAVVAFDLLLASDSHGALGQLPVHFAVRQGVALAATAVSVDDDGEGDSTGNGDGLLDPGERVELLAEVTNVGGLDLPLAALPGLLPWLVQEPTWIELDLRASVGWLSVHAPEPAPRVEVPLAAGASAEFDVAAQVEVAAEVPAGEAGCLIFDLVLRNEQGPLYAFEELRCFEIGGPLGPGCARLPEECNGRDDDCDGVVDEDLPVGPCGDCHPTPAEVCDGADNDCDGATDEDLQAPSGRCPRQGVCAAEQPVCQGAAGWDCRFPATWERPESSCDGLDNDCDGVVDEGLQPPADTCPSEGVCAAVVPSCEGAQGWQCALPDTWEEQELSCDGLDNDCDGETDEQLEAPGDLCPAEGVCAQAGERCAGVGGWECALPRTYEDSETLCDGRDNDCDGATDEDLQPSEQACPSEGVCRAAVSTCEGVNGWRCELPAAYEEEEQTCDGQDNDCDGEVDEGVVPPAGFECLALGVCAGAAAECRGARGFACPYPATYEQTEQSCDELDNDCDGETDEAVALNMCGACGPVPPGGCADDCEDAVSLPLDASGHVVVAGDTSGASDDFRAGCAAASGVDLVYHFHLDQPRARSAFSLDGLRGQPGQWDTVLSLLRGDCLDPQQVACDDDGRHGVGSSDFLVRYLAPGDYYLVVDGAAGEQGAFTLDVQLGRVPEAPVNDVCEQATRVPLAVGGPTVRLEGSVGVAADDLPAAGCAAAPGMAEVLYEIELAEAASLVVQADALDLAPVGLTLLGGACSGPDSDELHCAPASDEGATVLSLPLLEAGTYWLSVEAAAPLSDRFELQLMALPPAAEPDNEGCADAEPLVWEQDARGRPHVQVAANHQAAADDLTASCGGDGGPDVAFGLALEQATSLLVQARAPEWAGLVTSLRAGACEDLGAEALCLEGSDVAVLPNVPAGDLYLLADAPAAGGGGPFEIDVTGFVPLPRAAGTCPDPIELDLHPLGTVEALGSTVNSASALLGDCARALGPEQAYHFHLDRPSLGATFRMESVAGAEWDTVLYLKRGSCNGDVFVACDDETYGGPTPASQIELERLPPGDYTLVADGFAADSSGPYVLRAELGPAAEPPQNDICLDAESLDLRVGMDPYAVRGWLGAAADDLDEGSCALAAADGGRDVFYRLAVRDEPLALFARVETDAGAGRVSLQLLEGGCEPELAAELDCQEPSAGRPDTELLAQRLEPGVYWLVLHGTEPHSDSYQLEVSAFVPPEHAPNESCAQAAPLELVEQDNGWRHARLQANTLFAADDLQVGCGGAGAGELVWQVQSEQDFSLGLRFNRVPWGAPLLYLLPADCEGAAELLCLDDPQQQAFAPRLPAGSYNVVLDARYAAGNGPVDLEVSAYPPMPEPTNDICIAAAPLSFDEQGHARVLASTAGAVAVSRGECSSATAAELMYTFRLDTPRGLSSFRVDSREWGAWDTVLYLRAGACPVVDDLACDDDGPAGVGTSEFTVGRLEAGVDYYLIVDGYRAPDQGPFLLDVQLGPEL